MKLHVTVHLTMHQVGRYQWHLIMINKTYLYIFNNNYYKRIATYYKFDLLDNNQFGLLIIKVTDYKGPLFPCLSVKHDS